MPLGARPAPSSRWATTTTGPAGMPEAFRRVAPSPRAGRHLRRGLVSQRTWIVRTSKSAMAARIATSRSDSTTSDLRGHGLELFARGPAKSMDGHHSGVVKTHHPHDPWQIRRALPRSPRTSTTFVDKGLGVGTDSAYCCAHATGHRAAMSWTTPTLARLWEPVTCCYCGRRAPRDLRVFVSAGWQGRAEYPVRYRCPRCRRRQEGEARQRLQRSG